ncbi:MAG: nucleotide pyrophosphohydrolase [bacterium]|nr:nucleotide pyrophosphohydrolase [bacterium]
MIPQNHELSFKEFQTFIRKHYQKYDAERGVGGTFLWFMEEVGELASALQNCQSPKHQATEAEKRNLEEEFADVLGWLSTLANMNDVDLEAAVRRKYLDSKDLSSHKF